MPNEGLSRPLLVGIWGIHGRRSSLPPIHDINCTAECYRNVDVALALPGRLIDFASQVASHIALGELDCTEQSATGPVQCLPRAQAVNYNAAFVLLGRYDLYSCPKDDMATMKSKLTRTLAQRIPTFVRLVVKVADLKTGRAEGHIRAQIDALLTANFAYHDLITLIFEPIYDHVDERSALEGDIAAMLAFIRSCVKDRIGEGGYRIRLLYGGRFDEGRTRSLLRLDEVDGLFVGYAAADTKWFRSIIRLASQD